MSNVLDPQFLNPLCVFGADVGSRLVGLSAWVNELPSAVKSLGFEIWAACEVLSELSMIMKRNSLNSQTPIFTDSALEDIISYVETCDEVFHEAARGVLVAYQRLKSLNLRPSKEKMQASGPREKIGLSFQERTRWPLFQQRTKLMMEALVAAKMDLSLSILVYWVVWEAEARRRSTSSIFSEIPLADRASLIYQLWNNKVRREEETPRSHILSSNSSMAGSGAVSIFTHTQTPNTSSPTSEKSYSSGDSDQDSLMKRLSSKVNRMLGLKQRKEYPSSDKSTHQEESASPTSNPPSNIPSRQTSTSTTGRSAISDPATTSPFRPQPHHLRRVKSEKPSLLSMAEASRNPATLYRSPVHKLPSWCAGPTKSAKEGIEREWQELAATGDDGFEWRNEEGEMGNTQNPRELGKRLLFAQLEAQLPYWAVQDTENVQEVAEMLIGRWVESGRARKRVAEWETVKQRRKEEATGGGTQEMRFHFAPTRTKSHTVLQAGRPVHHQVLHYRPSIAA